MKLSMDITDFSMTSHILLRKFYYSGLGGSALAVARGVICSMVRAPEYCSKIQKQLNSDTLPGLWVLFCFLKN